MAKILIVEDNIDQLRILRETLGSEHDVATARRGEDGIELARSFQPDIVILDLHLPAMDGIEAGRWIKRELGEDRVRILVLTGLAGRGETRRAVLDSGCCDAYLEKPASIAIIRQTVTTLLTVGGTTA
jgi:two-component system, cell cycle response regulator DivK